MHSPEFKSTPHNITDNGSLSMKTRLCESTACAFISSSQAGYATILTTP